jgi:hypothetical protein
MSVQGSRKDSGCTGVTRSRGMDLVNRSPEFGRSRRITRKLTLQERYSSLQQTASEAIFNLLFLQVDFYSVMILL